MFDSLHEDGKQGVVVQGQTVPVVSPTETVHVPE